MEESEEKLKARLEDFEAERKDAELAFKVDVQYEIGIKIIDNSSVYFQLIEQLFFSIKLNFLGRRGT